MLKKPIAFRIRIRMHMQVKWIFFSIRISSLLEGEEVSIGIWRLYKGNCRHLGKIRKWCVDFLFLSSCSFVWKWKWLSFVDLIYSVISLSEKKYITILFRRQSLISTEIINFAFFLYYCDISIIEENSNTFRFHYIIW
jgi:hypothetical protein